MALLLADGAAGAELHSVIAAADALNHAIPNHLELSRSMTKFLRCGLLCVTEGRYRIAQDWLPAVSKAREGKGGLFVLPDKGLAWLRKSGLVAKTDEQVTISEAAVEDAYKQYLAAIKKDSGPQPRNGKGRGQIGG